eukprot:TRINITY_DN444_c0_g1_i1.p1 TRINITY_DN444_c0_g1~~TRINITY_DN444_c0_g1_i1.p1  ORF type:complete len:673 (+),score=218.40 TRINITY_DN444_c0_g1_i1:162-2180(+)
MKCPVAIAVFSALQLGVFATEAGPIGKVQALLTDLKAKLERDGDADESDFQKHECWCDKIKQSKTALIAEQKAREAELASDIEKEKATDNQLVAKIKDDKEEIDDNKKDTKDGNKQEAKEEASSRTGHIQDNAEMNQLSKAQKFLRGADLRASGSVLGVLDHAYQDDALAEEDLSKHDSTLLTSFERWHTDMVKDFNSLDKDKRSKEKEDTEVRAEIAEDIEMKVNTEEQRKADEAFLAEAEDSCAKRKVEYNNRTTLRNVEMAGVNKAIEILDSQRELLSTTFKGMPSFLQMRSTQSQATSTRASAFATLQLKARRTHSLRLASLAAQVQEALPSKGFEEVLKKVDDMMTKIKTEAASDTKKKGYCKQEYQVIAKKSNQLSFMVRKSSNAIKNLESRIAQLKDDKEAAEEEIADIKADLNKSLTLRLAENKAFKKAKTDDELAISVLKNTSAALSKYYEDYAKNNQASLLAYDPEQLSDTRKKLKNEENKYDLTNDLSQENAASSVLALMTRIIENLNTEIADGMEEEKEAQLEYESIRDKAMASKSKLEDKVTNIDQRISARDTSKRDETKIKEDAETDLKEQNDYKASIQEECEWLYKNFDDRVNTREAEMDGLVRAKELLSGASFLQRKPAHQAALAAPEQSHEDAQDDDQSEKNQGLMNYLGLAQLK